MCAIVDTGTQFERRWGMGLPTTTLSGAVWTPAQPHTYSMRTLCLLGVAGSDRSVPETGIRHQCQGQL